MKFWYRDRVDMFVGRFMRIDAMLVQVWEMTDDWVRFEFVKFR